METNPTQPNTDLAGELLAIAAGAAPCANIEQSEGTLERDNTFPIASTIAALDRAIGLCLVPEHVFELLERRASLEDAYEHAVDLCYAGQEAIANAAKGQGLAAP